MAGVLESVNRIVWGAPVLALILGVGIYLTLKTGFAQFALFPGAVRHFFRCLGNGNTADGVSPFRALCTALAATVGTGNLVGVAGAIALGGPGAVFWMWICALLGMVIKFAEATLAVSCRQKENGEFVGGPMYMIRLGLGPKWHPLAAVYSFFGIIAAFGVGNATQINAVVSSVNQTIAAFGGRQTPLGDLAMGLILGALIGVMLLGGAKRIGQAAEFLVPFASCAYLLLGLGVLIARLDAIPHAFISIVRGAFSPCAVTGGLIGSAFQALRVGVARGVFTNEAGMGTASIAHAGAHVSHPAQQGLLGMMEVFLDTVVICTVTALVILVSGVEIPYGTDAGGWLTGRAFCSVYGQWVSPVLAAALCCFAIATVLGWGLYGCRCAQYLFGIRSLRWFALLQVLTVVLGAVLNTGTVWSLAETVNGLMAIPNLIALVLLSSRLSKLTNEYKLRCGKQAAGGTYENFNQCQSLSAFSHAKVPSLRGGGEEAG